MIASVVLWGYIWRFKWCEEFCRSLSGATLLFEWGSTIYSRLLYCAVCHGEVDCECSSGGIFKACLLQVNSHTELYHFLISLGAFKVAESVPRQSETGTKTITREVVASYMTKISPQMCVASKRCVSRHNDLYHQILGTMFAWGCEIAESFDQDGSYGIDASI